NIACDPKKRLFVSNIISMGHVLGITVIAEGVETEEEFYTIKELGCDMVQGFLIQKPSIDLSHLKMRYTNIESINRRNRREVSIDQKLIYEQMEAIKGISFHADILTVFDYFRKDKNNNIIPVLNHHQEPYGIIKEDSLKSYAYSIFGLDLIRKKHLKDFVTKCPTADVNTPAEKILEIFSHTEDSEGILITENGKYLGFLSSRSLLKVLNAKNLTVARDQNPLTKLPGNHMINDFISQSLKRQSKHIFVYFDFDYFKPFNDRYGFRLGDRVIILFAEILTQMSSELPERQLIGHIGGDDFFLGFEIPDADFPEFIEMVQSIIKQFTESAFGFHSPEDQKQGFILAKDREGNSSCFPLLTVSSGVLCVPTCHQMVSTEEIGTIIASLKKEAKTSKDKMAMASLVKKTIIELETLIYHNDFFETSV
ncbi:MAG TPA: EAL domain-containing protein, partial [Spirochaetes bacterium]|nr:EAL domain-containing protein [Spirochaetota bacterium]